jgi:hypothetical protein
MNRTHSLAIVALLTLAGTSAAAEELYLNGSNISDIRGVQDLDIRPVDEVIMDASGDIHILAPQYTLRDMNGQPLPTDPAAQRVVLGGDYMLITVPPPNSVGWSETITVSINGRVIQIIEPGDQQIVVGVNQHLHSGSNEIVFTASGTRSPPAGELRVMVGRGDLQATEIRLEDPVAMTRRAGDQPTARLAYTVELTREEGLTIVSREPAANTAAPAVAP